MVFQFEHVGLDQGRGPSGTCGRCDLPDLKAILGRWQAGLADVGWNSLYWNNHDQPRVVSRFGDDGEYRVASAKMLGTVLHLHRGTPYVYQGEELGMTNARSPRSTTSATSSRSTTTPQAVAAGGRSPEDVLTALRAQGPGQRPHADAVGRLAARRLHHRRAVAAGQPQPRRDQRGRGQGRPGLGLPPLPPADRAAAHRAGRRDGDFTMLLPDDERLYAFTRTYQGAELLVLANLSGAPSTVDVRGGPRPSCCSARTAPAAPAPSSPGSPASCAGSPADRPGSNRPLDEPARYEPAPPWPPPRRRSVGAVPCASPRADHTRRPPLVWRP